MMKKFLFMFLVLAMALFCVSQIANADDWASNYPKSVGIIDRYTCTWTGDATGGYTSSVLAGVNGILYQVIAMPSTTAAPSAYSLNIDDSFGAHIVAETSLATSPAATCYITPLNSDSGYFVLIDETLRVYVSTDAGKDKEGTIYVDLIPLDEGVMP